MQNGAIYMDLTFNGRRTSTMYVWNDAFITRSPAVAKKLRSAVYCLDLCLTHNETAECD